MAGWGSVLNAAVFPAHRADWGLRVVAGALDARNVLPGSAILAAAARPHRHLPSSSASRTQTDCQKVGHCLGCTEPVDLLLQDSSYDI